MPSRTSLFVGLLIGLGLAAAAWTIGASLWQPTRMDTEDWGVDQKAGPAAGVAWDGTQPLVFYRGGEDPSALDRCGDLEAFLDGTFQATQKHEAVDWTASMLFAVADEETSTDPNDIRDPHGELRRFCRVTGQITAVAPTDHTEAVASVLSGLYENQSIGNYRVAPALPVLSPAATKPEIGHMSSLFQSEVGRLMVPAAFVPTRQAKVVLVDTEVSTHDLGIQDRRPKGSGPQARNSGHGYALANLVDYLACSPFAPTGQKASPPASCPIGVDTRLGLSLIFDPSADAVVEDLDEGGSFGNLAGLAQGIRRATIAAAGPEAGSTVRNGGGAFTVLNLSVAWNPMHVVQSATSTFGSKSQVDDLFASWSTHPVKVDPNGDKLAAWIGLYGQLPPDSRAVMAALVDARCRGLLPVTAAGNPSAGTENWREGPALPAAWMDLDPLAIEVPSLDAAGASVCQVFTGGLGGSPHSAESTSHSSWLAAPAWEVGHPLLYAVSGFTQGDHDAQLHRPDGRSPLSAYGFMAPPGPYPSDGLKLDLLTGTSASAAVMSASAALAYVLDDEDHSTSADPAHAVMNALYEAGRPLMDNSNTGLPAEFAAQAFGQSVAMAVDMEAVASLEGQLVAKKPMASTFLPAPSPHTLAYDGPAAAKTGLCGNELVALPNSRTTTSTSLTPSTVSITLAQGVDPCADQHHPGPDADFPVWPQPFGQGCNGCGIDLTPMGGPPPPEGVVVVFAQDYWEDNVWLDSHDIFNWTQASLKVFYPANQPPLNLPVNVEYFKNGTLDVVHYQQVPNSSPQPVGARVYLTGVRASNHNQTVVYYSDLPLLP